MFGYQVIMLIMFAVLQDTEGHQFIGIHDRLHDGHMIGGTPSKESFTEATSLS